MCSGILTCLPSAMTNQLPPRSCHRNVRPASTVCFKPCRHIELAEDLWDNVALEAAGQPLKTYEIAEIERRLAEHVVNPQDVVSWQTVKANLQIA